MKLFYFYIQIRKRNGSLQKMVDLLRECKDKHSSHIGYKWFKGTRCRMLIKTAMKQTNQWDRAGFWFTISSLFLSVPQLRNCFVLESETNINFDRRFSHSNCVNAIYILQKYVLENTDMHCMQLHLNIC